MAAAEGKIQLELVTPARRVLSQPVDEVRAPGAAGSFGVLPGHTDFVSLLKAGELVAVSGGQKQVFAIGEGFAQVSQNKVLVLTEAAERAEEIDLASAQAAVEAETKRLAGLAVESDQYEIQRAKVEREAARVLVASKKGH
jgi:F-type H+-transporting ATPase subunit epsilon